MHNHFHLLDKYQKYESTIQALLTSIMTSLDRQALLRDVVKQREAIEQLSQAYPFIELIYSLDGHGVQLADTVTSPNVTGLKARTMGKGTDRSHRPYFEGALASATDTFVTSPYLSSATHKLAISVVHTVRTAEGDGYLVLNFNLARLVSYLLGDEKRDKLHPYFQFIHGVIGVALIIVAIALLGSAFYSLFVGLAHDQDAASTSFGSVVMLTLALAVFDLGKTILEEEVLMSKDINHYHSTRRTIMRFISAIIIAVSIEALLLMFKSVLKSDPSQILNGVAMMLSGVGLLAGLGVYLKLSREER